MAEDNKQASLLNLIPVGLKEAALDSPTFRATALHFSDQIDGIERWLDGYVRAASKLVAEVSSLESAVNAFLAQSTPPSQVSEAVLDHDYTLLAMQRYGEGARESWQTTLRGIKRYDHTVVEPIKHFLANELRAFRDARRALDASQKSFDYVIARYLAQSKTKEPSSLREDAFQLHETRKAYLKASMEFCVSAPQLRSSLDQLIVRILAEQWKEMQASREANTSLFAKWSSDMRRIRGWSREMENSERAFKRELVIARQQIEESALAMTRPSRDIEDYAKSTVPYLGTGASTAMPSPATTQERAEKQGWMFLRTITGKPTRTVWVRRWFYVKNGIFGWLVQGLRSGGVEESEKIGVLLCSVRPCFQEERRFCFEVKTKDTTIVLQAETQQELTDWIGAFEAAKRKSLEDPLNTDSSSQASGVDPAFAISAPVAPEFAAKVSEGSGIEESGAGLSVPDREGSGLPVRASFDVTPGRRVMSGEKEPEGSREHAARIIQKLDLHKRSATATPQLSQASPAGGIASLISASHNILPVGPGAPPPSGPEVARRNFTMPTSSLAPSTLVNPPTPTNLSHMAVVVSGEGGVNLGRFEGSGTPSGIMANLWGSSNWGYVNRLGDDSKPRRAVSGPVSPAVKPTSVDDVGVMDGAAESSKDGGPLALESASLRHRKNLSVANDEPLSAARANSNVENEDEYPNYYPLPLKAQHAQFRMLFPSVPRSEKIVLVFRATWNPNAQQEFPGRVYVTAKEIYFFSNHLGLVLITGVSLSSIREITAAPGRDCDFLYLHLKETDQQVDLRRITVKVFLEPLRLLQRRLKFLVENANSESPDTLEKVLKALIKMEVEEPRRSSSAESWEDVEYEGDEATTNDQQTSPGQTRRERNVKAQLRIDGTLYGDSAAPTGREVQKFRLPAQPVVYAPQGMQASVTRDFNVSAKALFHVIFGDKSAVFQLLYANRWADKITRSVWEKNSGQQNAHWVRRFASQDHATPMADAQTIDVLNDHLCYVVTNTKTAWRLPYATRLRPTTKFVITHTAKSRCKLAIFQQIVWIRAPTLSYFRHLIERQALNSLEADALDLTNVAMDQVNKLGSQSKTNRAVEIFGNIGQQQGGVVPPIPVDTAAVPNMGGLGAAGRVRARRPVGIVRLIVDDTVLKALSLLGWFLDLLMAVGKGVLSACTAHSMLVALLGVSALYNGWFGYRDGVAWYHERSTSNFMARLGVTPDPTMTKAIYLREIDELIAPPTPFLPTTGAANATSAMDASAPSPSPIAADDAKTCRSSFRDQLAASTVQFLPVSGQPRLRRTRDALARYRHDLLVALRVVNRVERDVVTAEWEDWVRAEGIKCESVERMVARAGPEADEDAIDLGEEFAEYCRSCKEERDGLGRVDGNEMPLLF